MGTNIDDLIEDISNNKLSNEENSMVDSIINDLNNDDSRSRKDAIGRSLKHDRYYGTTVTAEPEPKVKKDKTNKLNQPL